MVSQPQSKKFPRSLIFIFLLFTIAIGTTGILIFELQKKRLKQDKWDQISAIASLKARQVTDWRRDRMEDAKVILDSPFLTHHFQQFLKNPKATGVRQELLEFMTSLQKRYHYQRIFLLDATGMVRLSAPEGIEVIEPLAKKLALEAIREKKVILSDFYRSEATHLIRLSLLVPLLIPQGRDVLPVGALLLRIDPYQFLYPLLQSWPTPSRSSEIVLVRREGDEVLFLNDLIHKKNTALNFRLPISEKPLPAVMAVMGKEGVVEGVDYRGLPVLAALRKIPDSPWFLIAKVDQEEVYALIHVRARFIAALVGLLILGAALSVLHFWRHQRVAFNKKQYQAELERKALEKHFDYLTRYANDIILLMDEDLRIVEANERAVETYGYSREEMLKLSIMDLRTPEARSSLISQLERVKEQNGAVFDTIHQRKDGMKFPVENSTRVIKVEGKSFYQAIIRDITERKRAEEALRESESKFRTLVEQLPGITYIAAPDEAGSTLYVSPQIKTLLGFSMEEWLDDPELWLKQLHPDDRHRVLAELNHSHNSGKPFFSEYRMIANDGRILWFNDQATIIRDETGKPLFLQGIMVDITERKRMEDALRASYNFLEIIYLNKEMAPLLKEFVSKVRRFTGCAAAGIRILDEEGRIPYQVYEGFSQRFYVSENPLSVNTDRCMCINVIKGDIDPGLPFYTDGGSFYMNATTRFLATVSEREKGETRNACNQEGYESVALVPIRLKDQILGLIHVADPREGMVPLDVVEVLERAAMQLGVAIQRMQGEERLRESSVKFQELFDSAPVGYHEIDTEGRITQINRTELEMLGYTAEEMLCQPASIFMVEEKDFQNSAILPPDRQFERKYRRKDGTIFPVLIENRLLRDAEGRTTGSRATIEDITERKRVEEDIKTLKQQIEFILGVTKTGLDIIDSEFNIRYIDPEWAKVYGDASGRKCYEYFMDRSEVCPGCGILIALKTKAIAVTEEILVKEGNRPIQVTTIPFQNSDGEWLVAEVNVDITERKQSEEVLRKSEENTRQLAKENEIIAEIGRIINSTLDINEVYQRFAEKVGKLIDFDRILIDLNDIKNNVVKSAYVYGIDVPRYRTGFTVPFPGSINEHLVLTHSGLIVETDDKSNLSRFITIKYVLQAGLLSIMSVPLISKNEVIGGLHFRSVKQNAYNERDLRLAERVGNQIAGAIANAQLFIERKRAEEENKRNYETQTIINSLLLLSLANISLEEMLKQVLELILSIPWLVFESRGAIFLVEDEPDALVMKQQNGLYDAIQMECKKVPFGRCLCGRAALKQEIQFSNCLDEKHEIRYEGIVPHGHYCVPILSDGKTLGVINFYLKEGHQRNQKEEEFIKTIANVMAGITQRKRVEKQMAVLQEQFYQSQKMEAVGQLASGVAHDFNNLLTVIRGYSDLLLSTLDQNNPLYPDAIEIKNASERAESLTRQLLAFSRKQVLQPTVMDLNTHVLNMNKMLRRLIGEDVELITCFAEDLGQINADPGQIEQVIINLAVNARDAMPTGGKLTIETTNVEVDENFAHSHIDFKPGHYVMLSLTDTGHGISPEIIDHIFEPFFTTKESGKGTGLGLSTVYGIIKQSNGNIRVESEVGRGTSFKIYLPRVEETLDEMSQLQEPILNPLQGSETILLVEDEEVVRKLAHTILKKKGYRVLVAKNGEEALQIVKTPASFPIHLLLTDVVMPGISGPELASRLTSAHPEIKVLYISGYIDHTILNKEVLKPGKPYLQKPFTPEGLARKVREVINGQYFIGDNL